MADGTGSVYQRGKVWWLYYGHRGERYRESSGSRKKTVAQALLRQRMAEIAGGAFIGPQEREVTIENLRDLHMTDLRANGKRTRWAKTAWKRVLSFFAGDRALDVTTQRLKLYLIHRQEEGAANSTIRKELAVIRRAFNLAVKEETILTSAPAVPSVTVNNTRRGFFEAADLEAVVEQLPAPLRPVVRFAALTGWRKGEVLPLQWRQVDFEAGEIRLEPGTTKNKRGRTFPFRALPPLADLLERQREHTRALEREQGKIIPHVFHRSGQRIESMRGAWNAACKRAGLEGLLFHDLRRTAVRNLERAGVPRSTAMKLTGHETESVYTRYAITDRTMLEEGVEKLANLHAGSQEARKVVPLVERG
jgi:integrase